MRILVCGGRYYRNHERLDEVLDEISMAAQKVVLIINGGASGADSLAVRWAEERMLPVCTFTANWPKFGAAAGPIRNEWMLTYGKPDLVVAFSGGRGTANMVRLARGAGVEVREIDG